MRTGASGVLVDTRFPRARVFNSATRMHKQAIQILQLFSTCCLSKRAHNLLAQGPSNHCIENNKDAEEQEKQFVEEEEGSKPVGVLQVEFLVVRNPFTGKLNATQVLSFSLPAPVQLGEWDGKQSPFHIAIDHRLTISPPFDLLNID